MAKTVRVRFRSALPGGGYTGSGRPRQGKTNVRGQIHVTSYTKGGEDLKPADLGLTKIDDLTLQVVEPMKGGNDPTSNMRQVHYSHNARQFYVILYDHDFTQFYTFDNYVRSDRTNVIAGGEVVQGNQAVLLKLADWKELSGGTALTVSFDAFGDSAQNIELG